MDQQRAASICFRHTAPLQMYKMTPFTVQNCFKETYVMIGIKKESFCVDLKNL
jgi:hypothetical protein